MPRPVRSEATLSIRLLWPFARLLLGDPRSEGLVERAGISLADYGNPETRVPHSAAMHAMEETVRTVGDPAVGLRAAAHVDPGDYDVLEYAARSAPNFGETLRMFARYGRILHEALEMTLTVEGDFAIARFRITDGIPQPPAANDYTVATAIAFANRNVAVVARAVEVHLVHQRPPHADEYERILGAPPRFGMPTNGVVMHKSRLETPMLRANPDLSTAFELQARRLLEKMRARQDLPGRVRAEVAGLLPAGSVSMPVTARRVGMSATTLRRRLEEEGTTFSEIVDALRKEIAEAHLSGAGASVSEVAFLLGFSDVRAFGRAFRRWTGVSPTEYRTRREGNGHGRNQ